MNRSLMLLTSPNFTDLDLNIQREVYEEFCRIGYPIIYKIIKDHSVTEDIIQDSFLKAVRNIPSVTSEYQLINWVKTVVRSTTYNYIGKKSHIVIDIDNTLLDNNIIFATDINSVVNEVELKILSETIGKYLHDLKPEYQHLIELRWKQEMTYREIAVAIGVSEEVVKQKLYYARRSIKKRFIEGWDN
ncbi:RNA polymerase sigma factor [Fontibacillus sp. BL9]|uniref:RNA polymerase sigma factor n=1 Tax=Fontibacillus sp. BL9 TaxID=3389971 RepID=UPI0039789881